MLRDNSLTAKGVGFDDIYTSSPGTPEHDLMPHTEVQTQEHVINPLDDVFGSAPSSPALNPTSDANATSNAEDGGGGVNGARAIGGNGLGGEMSDIHRLRSTHVTNGYREGIAASKEQHIQAGFDEGYSLGAELGLKVGGVLGALEGLWFACRATEAKTSRKIDGGDGQGESGAGGGVGSEGVKTVLSEAEEQLDMKVLFGEKYFGSDGIWIYEVPGQDDESETTFEKVAAAHPIVVVWEAKVKSLAAELGLSLRR